MSWISEIAEFGVTLVTFASRVKRVETKQEEIVTNYLNRFDDVKTDFRDRISASQTAIIDRINESHQELIDRINKKK